MLLRINGNAQAIEQELIRVAGIQGVEREQAAGDRQWIYCRAGG